MTHASPPTALWVVPVSDVAGVARHVLDVIRTGLPGHRLVVLCPPGPLADAARAAGGAVLTGPLGPDAGLKDSVATLRHAVRTLRPAIVHSHLSYADVVVAVGTARGPRLVTTEHGIAADDLVYHGSRLKASAMAGVHHTRLRRFDLVLAVSEATADAMRAKWHPTQPIEVIRNGVDPIDRVPRPPGLRIVSLSRLAPEKRLPDLVAAFELVAREHPQATLTLAGIGPEQGALERQVADLGLTSRVNFPGFVDPVATLRATDVVAQLSVWENCSYTLLDAITHGAGVVASKVGGNPEMLPAPCLVDAGNHTAVAQRLVTQGLNVEARPKLPRAWPDVRGMASEVSEHYRGLR